MGFVQIQALLRRDAAYLAKKATQTCTKLAKIHRSR
jgi:hypothetical protein